MRRPLGACVVAVLALTGCGSTPRDEAWPPLPVVDAATGPQWRAIAPGLDGGLRPGDANPCAAGSDDCMPAVVAEMTRRLAPLARACDHAAPFLLMYRQVSREVRDSVRADAYDDPRFVAHLDAVFATLYFHAADRWRLGERDAVPRVWRLAFAAAERRELPAIGDMLLGMNAHISRDLPYALAAVGLRHVDGSDAIPDVTAVNRDIARSQEPMLQGVAERFDPSVRELGQLDQWVDPAQGDRIIARWRTEAVRNAQRLLDAGSPDARRRVERQIDRNAALRSLLIWRATKYRDPAREARVRERACRA